MKRAERLLELAQFINGRRPRTFREIAARFDVSERTLYRDLRELDRATSLVRDEAGYRFLNPPRLPPLHLTAEERLLLHLALDNPSLTRRQGFAAPLASLRRKLRELTGGDPAGAASLRLAPVDRSGPRADAVLAPLQRAAEGRRQVEIDYHSLSGGDRRWRGVDPYVLFARAGAWYLVGRCHEADEPRLFRLDRVAGVRRRRQGFPPPEGFDLEAYLGGTWNVFRGEGEHDIELEADADLAPLFDGAQHHPDEEVETLPDGRIRYRVPLSSLEEIARWVLGFGGKVRVVAPPELAARVCELARGALAAPAGREPT